MNTASKPEGSGVATGSALATTLGIFSDNAFIISMTCGWPLTTSAVSTAYTFPVGQTAADDVGHHVSLFNSDKGYDFGHLPGRIQWRRTGRRSLRRGGGRGAEREGE